MANEGQGPIVVPVANYDGKIYMLEVDADGRLKVTGGSSNPATGTTPKGPIVVPVANYDGKTYMLEADADGRLKVAGVSNIVWKDASEQALADLNRSSSLGWTDLDLTAHTSPTAKIAILQLTLTVDSYTSGYITMLIRKNGTTPANYPMLNNIVPGAAARQTTMILVGMDTDGVVEYYLFISGTAQADFFIDVLGYIE